MDNEDADYIIYLRSSLLTATSCYPGLQLTDHLPSLAEQVSTLHNKLLYRHSVDMWVAMGR